MSSGGSTQGSRQAHELQELYRKVLNVSEQDARNDALCRSRAKELTDAGLLSAFNAERIAKLRVKCIVRRSAQAAAAQRLLAADRFTDLRNLVRDLLRHQTPEVPLIALCEVVDCLRISAWPIFNASSLDKGNTGLLNVDTQHLHPYIRGLVAFIVSENKSQHSGPKFITNLSTAFHAWGNLSPQQNEDLVPVPFSLADSDLDTNEEPLVSIAQLFSSPTSDYQFTRYKLAFAAGRLETDSVLFTPPATGPSLPAPPHQTCAARFAATFAHCTTLTHAQQQCLFILLDARSQRRCHASGCDEDALTSALLSCSKCRAVFYCGVACQKRDWTGRHKRFCRAPATEFMGEDMVCIGGEGYFEVVVCSGGKLTYRWIGDSKRKKVGVSPIVERVLTREERLFVVTAVTNVATEDKLDVMPR